MDPYIAKAMPLEYELDKELLRLVAEANARYGEYKSYLSTLKFDSSFFLNSILLTDSYKSTQIEGTQISQDEMYYLQYMPANDDNKEIQNLKSTVEYGAKEIKDGNAISFEMVNTMHGMILDSVRGANRSPGQIRTTQNWIGPRGCTLDTATFVPPAPEKVYTLLQNLYEYMNNGFVDPYLVNVALSHAQFETIHAYKDGNGRLGRALIPIHMASLDQSEPILYLSEILELYKPSYQRALMDMRAGNVAGYLKFFMQCVLDQCNNYIYKIKRINQIYEEDLEMVNKIKGNSIYIMMPLIMKQIVFTKKEMQDISGLSEQTVSRLINQLVDLGILIKDATVIKKGYRYQRVYEIFAG